MTRVRILVVDDEPLITRIVSRVLAEDHDVIACNSGREAREILQEQPDIELILCDVMMPEITGVDLYNQLSDEQRQRFLFMTAGQNREPIRRALAALKAPILYKPFTVQQLRIAVETLLHINP